MPECSPVRCLFVFVEQMRDENVYRWLIQTIAR